MIKEYKIAEWPPWCGEDLRKTHGVFCVVGGPFIVPKRRENPKKK